MIKFLTPVIQEIFHGLSIETQKEYLDLAEAMQAVGKTITFLYIEPDGSEIAVRIDEEPKGVPIG